MEVVNEKEKSLSFSDILGILRGGIVWIVIITILCTAIGGVYAFLFKKTTYTAKLNAQIYVETYRNPTTDEEEAVPEHTRFQYAALLADKCSALILSKDVMNACKEVLNEKGLKINGGLTIVPEEDQPFFTVTYTYSQKGGDVNAIKEEVAKTLNDFFDSAKEYINSKPDIYPWHADKIVVYSYAQAKDVSASTGKAGVIAIAFLIGLVLSVIFVLVKNAFDDTIITKEQIELITGNQIIATVDISYNGDVAQKTPATEVKKEGK